MKKTLLTALSIASLTIFAACNNDSSAVLTIDGKDVVTKETVYDDAKLSQQAQQSIAQALQFELPRRANKDIKVSDEEIDAAFEDFKAQYNFTTDEQLLQSLANYPKEIKTVEDAKKEFAIPQAVLTHLRGEDLDLSDKTLEKEFNENKEQYERVEARHILVEDEKTAKKVIDELKDGKDFAEAVTEYSKDESSKMSGGDLGAFNRTANFVPEFIDAAFKLKADEISEPVKSDYGFHIIEVTKRLDTFKDNRDTVKDKLIEKEGKPVEAVIKELVKKYNVKVHDDDLKEVLKQLTTVPEQPGADPAKEDAEKDKKDEEKKDEEKKDEKKDDKKKEDADQGE